MIRSAPLTNDEAKTIMKELGISEKPRALRDQRPAKSKEEASAPAEESILDFLLRELNGK